VRACVCVRLWTLSRSHFFVDFHQIGHRRVKPQKWEWVRWGSISPHPFPIFTLKTPKFGAWIGVFKPNSRNEKRAYYENYWIDSSQILHSDKDHQMPFVGCPHRSVTIPRWRSVAILEKSTNRKIVTSQPRFKRFWRNILHDDAFCPFWPFRALSLKFQKSKMAAAAILKNKKIAISRPRFNRFWRNLARWCISNLLTVPTVKNLKLCKSKMAAAAILKIEK